MYVCAFIFCFNYNYYNYYYLLLDYNGEWFIFVWAYRIIDNITVLAG